MNDKKQKAFILAANLIAGITMFIIMLVFLGTVDWYLKLIAYMCICGFTLSCVVFAALKKDSLFKTFFVANMVTFMFVAFFFMFNRLGIFDRVSDLDKIKELILSWGAYGYVVYILLQLFQVIVLPAPGFIFYLAGTALYGPVVAFLISYASVVLGSVIAFLFARYAGKPVVYWCIGKDDTDRYLNILGKKGNVLFVLMQLLPFFPDDILCMVAGLTKMKFSFFLVVMIIVRPVYIAAVCFFGTGDLIPFSGWGIPVWIAIFVVLAVGFVLFCKYQTQIEGYFKKRFSDKKTRT